jgi:hypothetical protein
MSEPMFTPAPINPPMKVTAPLLRLSSIFWGVAVAAFLIGLIWGGVLASSGDMYAGLYLFTMPLFAGVIWGPMGLTSLILAIISRVQREGCKAWAITLIVLDCSPVALVVFWLVFIAVTAASQG